MIDFIVQSIALPNHVSAKELLKFKDNHREELAKFRCEITRLALELPQDAGIEALRQAVNDQYEANVQPALRSLRHSLKAQSWDTALNGFLKASFFTAAPTSLAILGGIPTSVAILAGAGLSVTASVVQVVNQRQRAMIDNPYSYLLALERQW